MVRLLNINLLGCSQINLINFFRYKAWHAWAYMNFEAVLFFKHKGQNLSINQTLVGDNTNKGLVSLVNQQFLAS